MSRQDDSTPRADRGRTILSIVLLGVLLLAIAGLAWYANGALDRQRTATAELAERLRDVSAREALLAARLEATMTARPASAVTATPRPAAVAPAATRPGERRVFGKLTVGKRASNGWDVTLRIARYFEGDAAFGVATSKGDLPTDGVYIDETTVTAAFRLLTKTPVKLSGWKGATGASGTPSAEDLVRVLGGGVSPEKPWSDAWYWVTVHDTVLTKVEQWDRR